MAARIPVAVAADPQALPLLRRWLESNGVAGVRERVLMEIVRQAGGALDRLPQVRRRLPHGPCDDSRDAPLSGIDAQTRFETGNWKLGEPLSTPAGRLVAQSCGSGVGLRGVDRGRGGSAAEWGRTTSAGTSRRHRAPSNSCCTMRALPPWLRDGYPLIYVDDALAAVPGIAVDAAFAEDGDRRVADSASRSMRRRRSDFVRRSEPFVCAA